jgi:hypothetical protein
MPWHTSAVTIHFFPLFGLVVGVRFLHLRVAHCATGLRRGVLGWVYLTAVTYVCMIREGDGGHDYEYVA